MDKERVEDLEHYIAVPMPYPVRQFDCWWEGVIETPDAVFAFLGTPASSEWLRVKFEYPLSYRVTKELPAAFTRASGEHSRGMTTEGLVYEVVAGSFKREVGISDVTEAMWPKAKHYILITGDSELEVISEFLPEFEMVLPGQRPDLT